MSILVKLGVAVVVAGVGGLAAVPHIQADLAARIPVFANLMGLVATSASSAGSAGAIDKSFTARRVRIDGMVAQIEIVTLPQAGPIRLQANGKPDTMKEFLVRAVGDELLLRLDSDEDEAWFPWNLFNMWSKDRNARDLAVRISAPVGTAFDIEGMVGVINAGDIDAPLRLEGHAIQARFGRVQNARVSISGSGRIGIGAVKEALEVEVAGSGDIQVASAAAAEVEIAGGGNVVVGPLAGGLSTEIAGSGDVRVASVNGPVEIEVAGSGDILIEGGRADPFSVEIAGSGDVVFKGHAVNPRVAIAGSGDVQVGSMSGTKSEDIMGSGRFHVLNPNAPPPPAPPQPSQPTPPSPKKF